MMTHTICQGSNGVVEDQQVLVLIFMKSKHQGFQNKSKIWNKLGTGFLFQGGEGRTSCFLNPLVGVKNSLQQFRHQRLQILFMRLLNHPVTVPEETKL